MGVVCCLSGLESSLFTVLFQLLIHVSLDFKIDFDPLLHIISPLNILYLFLCKVDVQRRTTLALLCMIFIVVTIYACVFIIRNVVAICLSLSSI